MSSPLHETDYNGELRTVLEAVNALTVGDKSRSHVKATLAQLSELVGRAARKFKAAKRPVNFNGQRKLEIAGNIRTFNLHLNVLISALTIQLDLQRLLSPKLTTKELQQRKPDMHPVKLEDDYMEAAHAVFLEMKRGSYKGIHPDTFTCSQILRGLKAISRQQHVTGGSSSGGHQPSFSRLQAYLMTMSKHFGFLLTRYARFSNGAAYDETSAAAFVPGAIDPILSNSFMDLCTRFHAPAMATSLFERLHRFQRQHGHPEQAMSAPKDNLRQNASIQIGIVIKAQNRQNVDYAYDLFKRHQRWLARTSRDEAQLLSIFSTPPDEGEHNDITFGCLVDVLVRSGQVRRAEAIFDKILQAQSGVLAAGPDSDIWQSIKPNTIIYTTMIKAYSKSQNISAALKTFEVMLDR